MEDTKRAIAVKFSSSGTAFDYNFDPAQLTVRQLKEKLASHTTIPADSMRLVYSGRVLKDEDVVETYGVKEGHTIHVVRGAVNRATEQAAANVPPGSSRSTAASSNPFGMNSFGLGAVDPELMRSLMNSPMLRHFLSNPDFIRSMVMQNPTMRQMIERNPEIGHIINDPSFIRQTMDMARNPELMREMMRNNDRALANLETIPGGFNHLRRMYHTLQEPLESAGRQNDQSSEAANQRLAQLLNVERPPEGRINTLPLPNPWAPRNNTANSTQSAANQFSTGLPFGLLGFPGQLPFSAPSSISRASQNSTSSANSSTTTSTSTSASQTNASASTQSSTNASNSSFTGFGYPFSPQNLHDPELVRRMQQALQRVMSSSGYGAPRQQQQLLFPPSLFGPPHSFLANMSPPSSSSSSLGAPQQSAAQSTEPPETRFSEQLQSLEEMGFADQAHNIRALLAAEGDLVRAVEWLLQNPNS